MIKATFRSVVYFSVLVVVIRAELLCSLQTAETFSCSDSESTVKGKAACVTIGSDTYCNGYRQIGQNKDPIFAKFSGGTQQWCKTDYEVTPDDGTGYGVMFSSDSNELWGFFSSTGTQGSTSEDFRRFATNGWLKTYTDESTGGGGSKVVVVAKIDPATGIPSQATFITARKDNGNTNSVAGVVAAGLLSDNGHIVLGLSSAFHARNVDKSAKDCNCACKCCDDAEFYNDNALWNWELTLTKDLTGALYSCAPACDPMGECRPSSATVQSCTLQVAGKTTNNTWNWQDRTGSSSPLSGSPLSGSPLTPGGSKTSGAVHYAVGLGLFVASLFLVLVC